MKKFILSLVMLIATTFAFAQGDTHLKFKGIPLTGSLTSFVEKLKSKGMTYIGQEDGVALLKGEFAAYKDCTVGVVTFEGTSQVCKVSAIFPERETWGSIFEDYNNLKSMLTEKYGEPDVTETFSNYTYNDWSKFHAILNDECKFISTFKTDGGTIQLTMMKVGSFKACVSLHYYDKSNTDLVKKKAMDDL